MMKRFRDLIILAAFASLAAPWAAADALPIVPDGLFADWGADTPLHTDPSGDQGSSDVDFGRLWVANDADRLYLRLEIGVEKELQESNSIFLYVDSDDNAATGLSVGGIGAEFSWNFGGRSGTAYNPGGSAAGSDNWFEFGETQEPTTSGDEFEIAFDRNGLVAGISIFQGSTIAILFQNEDGGVQDRLPNAAQTVTYTFDNSAVAPHPTTSLDRIHPTHVRVMTHNTLVDGLLARPAPFGRILQATVPDIICYQELGSTTAAQASAQVASFLGGSWFAAKQNDTITLSRWPIIAAHQIDNDGNLGVLIDLPDSPYLTDLYVINAHPPCCSNEAGRQDETDAMVAWIRDLKAPATGPLDLPAGTPIVVTGDMNYVGFVQQPITLLTGDIQDEFTHGPDHAPDWDGSPMTDAFPTHTTGDEIYTWRNDGSSFPTGRLDYFVYTDSAVDLAKSYVLWTPTMDAGVLAAAGLLANDTPDAADHNPIVADFIVPGAIVPVGISLLGAD